MHIAYSAGARLGAAIVKVGMDFEAAMSEVQAISGATGEDLEKLEAKAREMGSSTSKSATQAAEAMSYMALAGWDVNQVMSGNEPVLKLSVAGKLDLARASDLVTDSMSALGIQVQDLPVYLDALAQSSKKSNTAIDQMTEAYLKVGGTFNGLNVPLAEGAAALGILANRGQKGAEAGNSLSSILVNLTSPIGQAKNALDKLSFSAFDSEGNFRGLEVILYDLKDKMAGMTQEQRNQMIAMIAGKEQLTTFNNLLDGLGSEYDNLKVSIENSKGALNDMAEAIGDNRKGAFEILASSLEEIAIQLDEVLKPAVVAVTSFLQKMAVAFANLSPGTQTAILAITGVVAAIGPVLIALGLAAQGVGALIGVVGALSAALPTLGAALTAITGPVGIAVAAIAGLIAIGIAVYKNWDDIKKKLSDIWNGIQNNISNVWSNITSATSNAVNNLNNAVKSKLEGLWNYIKGIPSQALRWGRDIIQGLINGIKSLRIPMPHFDFSVIYKSVAGAKFPVPNVDVNWYKTGGIFTSPTLAGIGDVPEAVLPLDKLTPMLTDDLTKALNSLQPGQQVPVTQGDIVIQNMTVRNDHDIHLISKELYNLQVNAGRVAGRR